LRGQVRSEITTPQSDAEEPMVGCRMAEDDR
jgi:hypothetical protein